MATDELKLNCEIKEYAIGGKLLVGSIVVDANEYLLMQDEAEFKQHIKMKLATQMAKEMIENGLIEFTISNDHVNQSKMVRARVYLAPDNQIKILRTVGLSG